MVMGDYGMHVAPQTLMQQKNPDKARSDLVRIQYKRLVTSAESEKGAKLDIGWIKQISGGEPIVARPLYKAEIEFRVEAVIWFATNHLPVINEVSEAIWRRIWLIPFDQVIPEDKRILDYEIRLIESEGSGILNWMLEGLQRYYNEGGLIKPDAITRATDNYKQEEDPIGEFLQQCCTIEPTAVIVDRELYGHYRDWCLNAGLMHPMKKNAFTRNLIDHPGIKPDRNKFNRLYRGVRLKTEEDKAKERKEIAETVLSSYNS
jgi:putative DNA primase/helicase